MRLGEGSGAMAAVPLIAMACAGITEVPTITEWFGHLIGVFVRPECSIRKFAGTNSDAETLRRHEKMRFRPSVIASSPTANDRRT